MAITNRPLQAAAWARFQEVDLPLPELGAKIGGKVGVNISTGIFGNACPLRISYMLNYSGFPVPKPKASYSAVSGADRKWYLFRTRELIDYLAASFGPADEAFEKPRAEDLAGMQGILLVRGSGGSDPAGHVTLWNGERCADDYQLLLAASRRDSAAVAPRMIGARPAPAKPPAPLALDRLASAPGERV